MHLRSIAGRWYCVANYFDRATGKRHQVRRSTGIRDDGTALAKKRAAIVGAEIELDVALGHNRVVRKDTLAEAFKTLIKKRELAGAPFATIDITMWKGKALVDFFGPEQPIDALNTPDLERYARERGVSPNTVRREFSELNAARKAVGLPAVVLPVLPPAKPKERWLTPDECVRLLNAIPIARRDYILAFLQLGVRKSELGQIRGPDVFDSAMGPVVRVRGTKTERADRVIPLTPLASALFRRRVTEFGSGQLFPQWTCLDRDLRKYASKAELGSLSANDLRRTFATQLAIAGVPILHLKALLGHASTRMLERVYARVGAEHTAVSVNKLPDYTRQHFGSDWAPFEPPPAETVPAQTHLKLVKNE